MFDGVAIGNKLWNMIANGDYVAAIQFGNEQLAGHPEQAWQIAHNLAAAFLALGRFKDAYSIYSLADNQRQKTPPPGGRYLDAVAQAAWLCCDHQEALDLAKHDVALLAAGKTLFADYPGGASNALFLYYASVTLKDGNGKRQALAFLKKLSKRTERFKVWPGPLAGLALGVVDLQGLLHSASGLCDFQGALDKAHTDVLTRRRMVETLFYIAAMRRDEGNESECRDWMSRCASLPNPLVQNEWYLAQAESNVRR